MQKQIRTLTVKAIDLKTGFGNPRKIGKKKRDELRASLEKFGDFGLFLIDENMNVIAGNQRLSVIMEINPEQELLCKQLCGYTNAELRAINIEDNVHAGEWDLDLLADCKEDVDKVLQELLHNRVILIPKYLAMNTSVDKNAGGDNDSKNNQKIIDCNLYMKQKWGKYYDFDYKKNTPSIRVKR